MIKTLVKTLQSALSSFFHRNAVSSELGSRGADRQHRRDAGLPGLARAPRPSFQAHIGFKNGAATIKHI